MRLLLGVDIGTSKICAIALDADSGTVLAAKDTENTACISTDADASEQDAGVVCDLARRCLMQLMQHEVVVGAEILALGVTGQMHGVVTADANGTPLTPLIDWQDQRGKRTSASGLSYTEAVRELLGDDLARTGCRPATGYGGVTLYRLAQEGALPDHGVALTIQDLLVYQLTGVAATDPSDAASWGIFDAQGGTDWLPDIASRLGVPQQMLPPVYPTATASFPVRADMAKTIGLPAELPVAVALGDNQASFLGSVSDYTDSLLINLGTGGQMSVATRSFTSLAQLETRPLMPGYWLLVGSSLCGGRAYRLLAEFYRDIGQKVFGTTLELPAIYKAMGQLVVPDEGPAFTPSFAGSRQDPTCRAAVTGLDLGNFTPEHLTNALIQGMVGELVDYYRLAMQAGVSARRVVGAGNCVQRNEAVRQEIVRQTFLPLEISAQKEEAGVGAAKVAGWAVEIGSG